MTELIAQFAGLAVVLAALLFGVFCVRRPRGPGAEGEILARAKRRERETVARADEALRAATERVERTRTAEAARDPVAVANERIRRRQ